MASIAYFRIRGVITLKILTMNVIKKLKITMNLLRQLPLQSLGKVNFVKPIRPKLFFSPVSAHASIDFFFFFSAASFSFLIFSVRLNFSSSISLGSYFLAGVFNCS